MLLKPARSQPRFRRRKYLIDPHLQFGVAARMLVPVAGVAGLSTVAVLLFMGGDDAAMMNSDELRRFLLVANGFYFVLQASILVVASLVLTHRIAGPAFVLKNALDGMLEGDNGRRLLVRDYDYLKDVSDRVAAVRGRMQAQRAELDSTLKDLQACLAQGEVEEAQRIVAQLRLTGEVTPRTEAESAVGTDVVREAGRATAATAV